MARSLSTLLFVVLMTSALAGCFHGGDDGDEPEPSPTPTTTPTPTNTTDPFEGALVPPVPSMNLTVANASGALAAPYYVTPGETLNLTFNGSGSTDSDGAIIAWSWIITGPTDFDVKGTGAVFSLDLNVTEYHFGVYNVQLRVLDDDSVLNGTSQTFILNYRNSFASPLGMTGPGTFECQAYPADRPAGSALAPSEVVPGTFANRTFAVRDNASAIDLELTYTSDAAGELGIYLFAADQDTEACADAAQTVEPAASPLALAHSGALVAGTYTARIELDGPSVSSFTLSVRVTYAAPADAGEEDETEA